MKKYLIFIFALVVLFSSKSSLATKPSDFGLKEGDLISAIFSDDPDVYIINEQGYKRLFLNPEIFKFYTHLGGFANIKLVTPEIRDSFPTSGFFRNCEDNDQKVFGTSVEGEDAGRLHWINKSGDQAVQEDPDFFKKVFCINRKEFNWYPRGNEFKELREVPQYHRTEEAENYVICHHPIDDPKNSQTIRVAPESLDAHFQHGDTKGACPTYSLPIPQEVPATTPTPSPYVELCYNCPSPVTLSPSNVCRTFSYYGEDLYIQDAFLNLLRDKGVKITGATSGLAWSTRLSGTLGDTKEVVGFISPDRSEADLGISDNETLIIELTNEFAQAVEIGLTVMPSATSNNVPATVSITAFDQTGRIVVGISPTFTGVTDNKLTPATYVLKSSTSEISKVIIQTSQYPSGGVWLQSVGATNACTTISTPLPSYTPTPTPTYSPTPTPTSSATYVYDLAVVDVIPNPAIPEANKDFTVDVVFKNVGQKPITNPTAGLNIYDPNGKIIYSPAAGYIGIVNPGATIVVKFYSDMFLPRSTETTLNYPAGIYKMVGNINYLGTVDGINYSKDPYPTNDTYTKTLEIKSTLTSTPTPTPTPTPTLTVQSPVIVISPNGGECMAGIMPINWASPLGTEVKWWDLRYSVDNGSSYWYVMWLHSYSARSYNWATYDVIKKSDINSSQALIKVRACGGTFPTCTDLGTDISDNIFSINTTCPGGVAPVAPTNLTATPKTYSNGTLAITLSWTDNSSNELGFAAYTRMKGSSQWDVPSISTGTGMEYQGLQAGTTYEFMVRAGNQYGYSVDSNIATATMGSTATSGAKNSSTNLANITKDLYIGSTGNDVKQLQALLVNEVGYSADLITGYFGRITRDAVKRFQEKYGIQPTHGYFGAITRKALNALISSQ